VKGSSICQCAEAAEGPSSAGGGNHPSRPAGHRRIGKAFGFGIALILPIAFCLNATAGSAYLADINGNTEIYVDVDDEFEVVLWAVDLVDFAGYDCKITISGPATATGTAAHGSWFADEHTVTDGGTATPDYCSGMLSSPTCISGSGDVVIFTLHADDDGVVAINVDSAMFCLGDDDANEIEITLPSTLYVTVGTGEGMQGGGGESEDGGGEASEPEEGGGEQDEGEGLLDGGTTIWVDVNNTSGTETGSSTYPYNTIAEGLSHASNGDTVRVKTGDEDTYDEHNLDFDGKSITLTSDDTTHPENFIIDAGGSYSAFSFHNEETSSAIIDGFTITNGGNSAIRITGTAPSPTISNCVFYANARTAGGAIYISGTSPSPTISNCVFYANEATEGGAIWVMGLSGGSYPAPQIINNLFTDNTASQYGGAIYTHHSSPVMTGNKIIGNRASLMGGGMHCYQGSPDIQNNLIVGNKAQNAGTSYGGGVYLQDVAPWYSPRTP